MWGTLRQCQEVKLDLKRQMLASSNAFRVQSSDVHSQSLEFHPTLILSSPPARSGKMSSQKLPWQEYFTKRSLWVRWSLTPPLISNQAWISLLQSTHILPWDMSCRSTPCKRWRTGEVTCKRGRACPTPTWHCPNKPSESTKVVTEILDKSPIKIQVANGQHFLHVLSCSLRSGLLIPRLSPSSLQGLPVVFCCISLPCESYAWVLLTLNTYFEVRAESTIKQTTCRGTGKQKLRHPHTEW